MSEAERQKHSTGGYGSFPDCRENLKDSPLGKVGRAISCLAANLDYRFRKWDFRSHRSYDGPLSELPRVGKRFDGHAPIVLLAPALLALFVIFGPPLIDGDDPFPGVALGIAGWLASLAVLLAGMAYLPERAKFWFQLLWISALCGIVWKLAAPGATEATATFYRHILLGLIPLVLVPVAALAYVLGWLLLRRIRHEYGPAYRERLKKTELFQAPAYAQISFWAAVRSIVTVLLYRLLILLWLPSLFLVVVFGPASDLKFWAGVIALVWLVLIALMVLHPRLDAIHAILRRAFFTGGQLAVSVVIIVLGLGRLVNNPYIAPVIESSYGPVLFAMILAAYSFFWFLEYWLNRVLCEQLLDILRLPDDREVGQIDYPIDPKVDRTAVPADNRRLQIHGGARFVAVWKNPAGERRDDLFQLYEKRALFERLTPRSGAGQRGAATRPRDDSANRIGDLSNRIRFYFSAANLLLLGAIFGLGLLFFGGRQLGEQTIASPEPVGGVNLRELMFGGSDEDVLLLAASGGGTRAALYATGVLRGLSEMGQLRRLRLVSGVSGGGAALSYLAGRWQTLASSPGGDAWRRFQCTLDDPFIWDVLDGVGEWRVFGQTRVGTLLAESIARRFDDGGKRLKDVPETLGLILNTSLAGELRIPAPGRASTQCGNAEEFPECAREWQDWLRGSVSGGRLVFTNLAADSSVFPGLDNVHPSDQRINYTVISDPQVPLATAAALQANFPPVFTNAAVDVPVKQGGSAELDGVRYWVTDGGAVENRGVLSLLFALRAAVDAEKAERGGRSGSVRRFHLLVAEASGDSTGYSSFPGISSKFGAPAKLGSQLMKELTDEIRQKLETIGGALDIHYLAMPGPLRVDGGLGTHWMLAGKVRLSAPQICDPQKRERFLETQTAVAGTAVRNAIYDLFVPPARRDPAFACGDDAEVDPATVEKILKQVVDAAELPAADSCWPEHWQADWRELERELR